MGRIFYDEGKGSCRIYRREGHDRRLYSYKSRFPDDVSTVYFYVCHGVCTKDNWFLLNVAECQNETK